MQIARVEQLVQERVHSVDETKPLQRHLPELELALEEPVEPPFEKVGKK